MPNIATRLQHAWNAFFGRDAPKYRDYGASSSDRPDRVRMTRGADRSVITAVYNRIAMDVASVDIRHVRVDYDGHYTETIDSGLNNCLSVEANLDQSGRAFIQDAVLSMFETGCVALVPVKTDLNPLLTGSYDIQSLRAGEITQWYPEHVQVKVYNEKTGRKEDLILPKRLVAIVENPLYPTMNEPNSTLQRLMRKLAMLDRIDEATNSGKLNMIIQVPYSTKSPTMIARAKQRLEDIEEQLTGNKLGIAYADGTEKIVQLNRPLENNLLEQIEYLTKVLYNQLGLTEEVFNGTANEEAMLNYNNRTIEPILSAFALEMQRKFLTRKARTMNQAIRFFREPFRLSPVSNLADIADKFTRNEILTSNEFRAILGFKPADDPKADRLLNKNMPIQDQLEGTEVPIEEPVEETLPAVPQVNPMDTPLSELPFYNEPTE